MSQFPLYAEPPDSLDSELKLFAEASDKGTESRSDKGTESCKALMSAIWLKINKTFIERATHHAEYRASV
jgi:hypothetical protein